MHYTNSELYQKNQELRYELNLMLLRQLRTEMSVIWLRSVPVPG